MRLKKLGVAMVVVTALFAVLASSAFAAAVTQDVVWYTGPQGSETELSGSATATSEQVGESTFATTVAGEAIELHSTNIECIECSIENSGGTAVGSGKLKLTGVTVSKPVSCSTSSTITTKALSVKADYMIENTDYILFEPTAGSETGFATIELTGASCPIKTAIIPKGTLFVAAANATETQATSQEVSSSAAINSTAGGSLHVGTESASLTGKARFKLSSGAAFGTALAQEQQKQISGVQEWAVRSKPFGAVITNRAVTIELVKGGPEKLTNIAVGLPANFQITNFGGCEKIYNAGGSCMIAMEFKPAGKGAGNYFANLELSFEKIAKLTFAQVPKGVI